MTNVSNRQKILIVSTHLFISQCKHGFKGEVEVINPIPEDSYVVRTYQAGTFGDLHLVIHSESFPELKDGDEIPLLEKPKFNLKSVEIK
jgi:hypothetical protein